MKKVFQVVSLLIVLAMLLASVSTNGGTALAKAGENEGSSPVGKGHANSVYIVQMVDAPVVAYQGGIRGLRATKPAPGQKINPNSPEVVSYVGYLDSRHDQALAAVGGRKLYDYRYSYNGFAAELSSDQAEALKSVAGVLAVSKDELLTLDTSSTPDFLGLTAPGGLWDMGVQGEDVIIGIV
ncbi:MAG: protease inhibitor I9 family protein, partial [Anaerolineales bacterium]